MMPFKHPRIDLRCRELHIKRKVVEYDLREIYYYPL